MEFNIDFNSWFYKNCKKRRKEEAKVCLTCPFREYIEEKEEIKLWERKK